MENRLKSLFDYQRFESNFRLARLIEETENRYLYNDSEELSDDDLELVNAAGDIDLLKAGKKHE